MTAQQQGVYCTIIFYLYCNNGKCRLDPDALKNLCAREDFEKVWEKISKKFQLKNGFLKHKRVTRELKKARQFIQHQLNAGLASARKRFLKSSRGSAGLEPRIRKAKKTRASANQMLQRTQTNPQKDKKILHSLC